MTVPAHDGLVVGIAKELADIISDPRSGDRHIDAGRSPWTHWAHGFDGDDLSALAEDVVAYLSRVGVRGLLTRFVTELHAADLDQEARPS